MALVEEITDDILAQTSHNLSQGRELVTNIIQYLDDDAAWIELYCATGELLIPNTLEIHGELRELSISLRHVSLHFLIRLASVWFIRIFVSFRSWRRADSPRSHHPCGEKSGSRWIFRG